MPDGRFLLAFNQPALTWSPTWTRLDDEDNLVASYTIDRGRQYELDQTDTGRAVVEINDRDGILDPTNPSGPYYGEIETGLQALVQRYNPVSGFWRTRFRGFVEDYDYSFDPSQQVNRLTVSLVDLFERLSTIEMTPRTAGGDGFGDVATSTNKGQVKFVTETVGPVGAEDGRITRVLDHAGIPASFYVVFSGNVTLYQTIYSPGEAAMTAIQEAADAEFPGVGNCYVDRLGRLQFHGRLAKFSPGPVSSGTDWDYIEWKAGDHAAVVADGTNQTAQIRRFAFNRGLSKVINSALATPFNIADNAVDGQHVKDAASITEHGVRSWSAQSLITKRGELDDTTALQETKRFAQYYVDNYAQPHNRITEIGFRSMHPDWDGASETWNLLSRIDIADSVEVTIDSPGGGGFTGQTFFVEGIHETSRPLNPEYDDIEVTLDLSPRALYTDSPWE